MCGSGRAPRDERARNFQGRGRMTHLSFRGRRGLVVYQLVLIIIVLVILVLLALRLRSRHVSTTPAAGATPPAGATRADASGLPVMPVKPSPVEITFDGCPPGGDGRDTVLNRLKNRVDDGAYVSVPFAAVETLPWPRGVERRARGEWPASDRKAVSRYEGIPVSVEGYLAGAKVEGPETPNCHGADSKYRDWHIWLSAQPGTDRSASIVVETTPRVRAQHPAWRISELHQLSRSGTPVRISGWLMLDQEHPDQVGKTRGTIWEIHPIMKIEARERGRWVRLDDLGAH